MTSRLKILQLFNRYLEVGGEQGSVYRIGDSTQQVADVEYFSTSSEDALQKKGVSSLLKAAFFSMHNSEVMRRLERYQAVGHFDVWQVHNIFPVMSPSVYSMAFRRGIPVVQYLHNYRMSCVNGMFLNHGKHCTSCIHGNFTKAARTGCWRGSRAMSGWMGLVLVRLRALGAFEKIAAWIALSEAQRQLHIEMGVPAERICVLPHFYEADAGRFVEESGRDVLFVGRLSREKGVEILLDAWKLVPRGSARLRVVGEGPEREALERKVQEEAIPGVVFHGFVSKEEQAALWRSSAFSVVPSIWQEPFGMVVLEAWERGRTVVVSDVGGLAESVDHEVDGLKVASNSAEDWAMALSRLLAEPALCAEMARNGRAKLSTRFTRAAWSAQILNIYKKILSV